jgi:flavodoxin
VVAWFSWSGNTAGIAERIVGATGAQAFEIVPEGPYPEVYDDCTDVALQEQRDGVMPAYQGDVGGWDGVSVVYLGYPIGWRDLPQVIKSFIADHDWAGKTVVPFSTYYSSGWAGTPDKIADTCTGATVADGLSLGQNDLPGAYDQVEGWLEGLAL